MMTPAQGRQTDADPDDFDWPPAATSADACEVVDIADGEGLPAVARTPFVPRVAVRRPLKPRPRRAGPDEELVWPPPPDDLDSIETIENRAAVRRPPHGCRTTGASTPARPAHRRRARATRDDACPAGGGACASIVPACRAPARTETRCTGPRCAATRDCGFDECASAAPHRRLPSPDAAAGHRHRRCAVSGSRLDILAGWFLDGGRRAETTACRSASAVPSDGRLALGRRFRVAGAPARPAPAAAPSWGRASTGPGRSGTAAGRGVIRTGRGDCRDDGLGDRRPASRPCRAGRPRHRRSVADSRSTPGSAGLSQLPVTSAQ